MGYKRPRPDRLSEKLRQIRRYLDLSQTQMVAKLGLEEIRPSHISRYETNDREPSLKTLLRYARAAGIPLEILADDDLDLPDRFRQDR